MDNKIKLIVDTIGKEKFKFNQPISNFTAIKIGGPAKLFFIAFTVREIIKIVELCRQLRLPFLIFGTGSKVLISDYGFDGVVIKNRTREVKILSIKGKVSKVGIGVEEVLIEVESGVSLSSFVDFLNKQGLLSEEFVDIQGSIGGNIFINNIMQRKIESVKVINQDGDLVTILAHELSLSKHIILSAVFKIKASN